LRARRKVAAYTDFAAVSVSAPASRLAAGQGDVVEALRDVAGELARSLESADE